MNFRRQFHGATSAIRRLPFAFYRFLAVGACLSPCAGGCYLCAVDDGVATKTNGESVVYGIGEFWVVLPLLYMVGVQSFGCATFLTCIVIALKYRRAPLLVSPQATLLSTESAFINAGSKVSAIIPAVFHLDASTLLKRLAASLACQGWRGVPNGGAFFRACDIAVLRYKSGLTHWTGYRAAFIADPLDIRRWREAPTAPNAYLAGNQWWLFRPLGVLATSVVMRLNLRRTARVRAWLKARHKNIIAQFSILERMSLLGLTPELIDG